MDLSGIAITEGALSHEGELQYYRDDLTQFAQELAASHDLDRVVKRIAF